MSTYTPSAEALAAGRRLARTLTDAGASMTIQSGDRSATITPDAVSGHVTDKPNDRAFVPPQEYFGDEEFLESRELELLGRAIIDRYREFGFLRDHKERIGFVWKRKGGESGGKPTLGKCQRPSGLLRFYSGMEFVIWIAADYALAFSLTNLHLEARLFHELKHCGYEIDDKTGEMKFIVRAPDDALFWDELRRFGAWRDDLRHTAEVYAQIALPAGEA